MGKIASETMGIIGMPPHTHVSDNVMYNSMPVAEVVPCKPNFSRGMTLFSVVPDTGTYDSILSNQGDFSIDHPIKLAFLADNFPTDSFSNEYGETFLEKMTDIGSSAIQDITQMTGGKSITGAADNISKSLKSASGEAGGMTGAALGMAGSALSGVNDAAKWMMKSLNDSNSAIGKMVGGGAGLVNKVMAGHRVDFPQVWRNSGFNPSYSMTIRLYNPSPGNDAATNNYIVGPLAAILCLGIPRSEDGQTYNWPFFHKLKSKGIYNLNPSVISNITVVKGGDNQQIAFNQRMGIVDVRIDFISLYGSMILEEGDTKLTGRPTVAEYLKSLNDEKPLYKQYGSVLIAAAEETTTEEAKGVPTAKTETYAESRVPTGQATTESELRLDTEAGVYV